MAKFGNLLGRPSHLGSIVLALAYTAIAWSPAGAAGPRLWPNTSIRVTIVQWMPTKGVYERWDALSGEFTISEDRAVTLPVIGRLAVGDLDEAGLAAAIAAELKARIGLVNAPEATVVVAKYPPIYVVGEVKTPGNYEYRAGLTALQALAMSGGEYRPTLDGAPSGGKTDLIAQLRGMENAVMRSRIRIARFHAELSDDPKRRFDLPAELEGPEARAIYEQEKAIMVARSNLMERQAKSYAELRELLQAEINTLDKKSEGTDADIASVTKELRTIKSMVDKGIALPGKQSDLERLIRSYSASRLDLSTDVMRARQNIAEASRNLEGLYDQRRTELTASLQTEQANLDQLLLKQDAAQKHVLAMLANSEPSSSTTMEFSIGRLENGEMRQLEATDATVLRPGDVLRVTRRLSQDAVDSLTQTPQKDAVAGNSQ